MDPYAIDSARRRQAERIDRARQERQAQAASLVAPGTWGRVALCIADLLVSAGQDLRSRYRPSALSGGNGRWA
jgi:hypothetical protein